MPEQKRRYLADFTLDNYPSVVLEAKGQFTSADRKKMLLLKQQYPDTEFVMIFGRSHNTLSKKSETTYGAWCDKHGIHWLDIAVLKTDPEYLFTFLHSIKCQSSTTKKAKRGNSRSKKGTMKNSKQ